ncbi:MAG: 1-acyl-sn-glycerol-3-phosphate acyltransferase [Bacteroidales bacterium]|jgi:1-acyl-sn-glycerol-3-phosphate acyltransferase|nr:1-acyl-sn-glycerol-3-phosphate acyltransferase [Bacteroidales bacterium]
MAKFFLFLYDFFTRRKPLLYGIAVAIFAVSLFFASRIHFEEDITQFIPDNGAMKTSNAVFRNIKVRDRLAVHLYLSDSTATPQPDLLTAYCDSLAGHLSTLIPGYIKEVVSRADEDMIDEVYSLTCENLPIFLEEKDYPVIDSALSRTAIDGRLHRNRDMLATPDGFAMRRFITADPLSISALALKRLQQIQPDNGFDSYHGYFLTSDRRHLLFYIAPLHGGAETGNNAAIVDSLDSGIARFQKIFPEAEAEYFGGPAVSVCNARQIKHDTMVTLSIALLAIIGFIITVFRSKRAPLLILSPVVFGAAVSLMVLYFIRGTVSAITVGAGSVVVGIALNYSIHVLSHFRHATSPREIVAGLASPLTLGSFTTVGAFLGLTFAKSGALADFGLFAAFSLAGSALFCLVVLPHLLPEKPPTDDHHSKLSAFIERIASFQPEKKYWLLIAMAVATVVCLFFTGRTGFDSDMMHLNYVDRKLQQAERNLQALNSDASSQTVYLVSTGADLQDAEMHHRQNKNTILRLQEEGLIGKYASADALLIPEAEQKTRIARWNLFWTTERKAGLRRNLLEAGKKYKFNEQAFAPFLNLLNEEYHPINIADSTWVGQRLLDGWLTQTDGLSMVMCQVRVPISQMDQVYERLDGNDNMVILDRSYFAGKFVNIISDDFYLILFISSFIVFFALWITYGRIELTLMTFTPMALSWVWITGMMGILGIGFNIVNIIISTFIFGLGDDYSIFITDGLKEEYRTGRKTLPMHKAAIFMSAAVMIAGIGVLVFARHPALKSIAMVSVTGMLAVVLAAYTVQPFLFRWFISGRTAKGKYPYTLYSWVSSVYVFTYFGLGSILLSLLSLVLRIIPCDRRKKEYILHWLMSKLAKSTLYCYRPLKKKFSGTGREHFRHPAVIVANHQSFIDILSILSLHPKIVMLVNSWVWNSPFFGTLVRNTGFYHVEDGFEKSVDALRAMVAEGYSIAVFPEGTRSADGKMRRFHNGAFYLAKQLDLDILPVTLYGVGLVMPKTDPFNIRKGQLAVEMLPCIDRQQIQQNSDRDNARYAAGLMRRHYESMAERYQTTDNPYFRQRLTTNYVYKGPVVEWYLRIKLRMEHNYRMFNRLVPRHAAVTDLGCGYGFLAYMLASLSEERRITGVDYDGDKIETANHCFSKNDRLQFIAANAVEYPFQPSDVFILSDMLHYLKPEAQRQLLLKCAEKLLPGGIIIVRDADRNMDRKHQLTRLTEFFSTRLFRFNKTENDLHFLSDDDIHRFAEEHNLEMESTGNDRYTSNRVYVLKKYL